MKTGGGFQQSYNAQAAVEVESPLIVGGHVSDAPNHKQQLISGLESISPEAGKTGTTLVGGGYYSAAAVTRVEAAGDPRVLAAMGRKKHGAAFRSLKSGKTRPHHPKGRRSPKLWHGALPPRRVKSYMDCASKR